MAILEINHLSKKYSTGFELKEVSLEIEAGTIFAMLGQNGAGKTTIVKSCLNLIYPDSGEIYIQGVSSKDAMARKKIGALSEKFNFYPHETVESTIRFFQSFRNSQEDEFVDILNLLKLEPLKNRKLSGLSKGQLQKVGLASSMIGDLDLFFLDEPFSGLDPLAIRDVKDLFLHMKSKGKTVYLNSHILAEMEILADSFAILHQGEIKVSGMKNELLNGKSLEQFFIETVKEI